MSNPQLTDALDRAERALDRLDRAASSLRQSSERERRLKSTVREVVAELDSLIAGGSR
jgi:ABC-type transporter Mla subunit MlaD